MPKCSYYPRFGLNCVPSQPLLDGSDHVWPLTLAQWEAWDSYTKREDANGNLVLTPR